MAKDSKQLFKIHKLAFWIWNPKHLFFRRCDAQVSFTRICSEPIIRDLKTAATSEVNIQNEVKPFFKRWIFTRAEKMLDTDSRKETGSSIVFCCKKFRPGSDFTTLLNNTTAMQDSIVFFYLPLKHTYSIQVTVMPTIIKTDS